MRSDKKKIIKIKHNTKTNTKIIKLFMLIFCTYTTELTSIAAIMEAEQAANPIINDVAHNRTIICTVFFPQIVLQVYFISISPSILMANLLPSVWVIYLRFSAIGGYKCNRHTRPNNFHALLLLYICLLKLQL